MAKRAFDLLFAAIGLILSTPLLLAAWGAIKLDDRGPLFYRQKRVGQLGRPFQILKIRTMRVDSEAMGPSITAANDSRITSTGRVLRRAKLDELPQLWNVLKGEMSIVGPRPEVAKYVALYTAEQRKVLSLRPGITDEASIFFRSEEALLARAADPERFYVECCMPRKIEMNLSYAGRANIFSDISVIFRTIDKLWLRH